MKNFNERKVAWCGNRVLGSAWGMRRSGVRTPFPRGVWTVFGALLAMVAAVAAQPAPGDVFREYSWKTEKFHVLSLNENHLSTPPIRPLTALKAGENPFSTVVAKGRMPDVYMPGVQLLIRYGSGEDGAVPEKEMRASAPVPVKGLQISQAAAAVDVYDYLEVTIAPDTPVEGNPFTEVVVEGEFSQDKGGKPQKVDGFCDSQDGSSYKIRFMPSTPGDYRYTVTLRRGGRAISGDGSFTVRRAWRRGLLRVDPRRPFHFIWEGTGEHCFWNGTTAYYLMGWQSDEEIRGIIDRLGAFKINRLRVLLYGRNEDRPWGQPVKSTDRFKLYLNPWVAQRPDDVKNPGFDLRRFNVAHWQRYERMLAYAQKKGMVISVIPFIGAQVLPTPFAPYSEEERLYYRYAGARLSAFSNITWDLGNEHDLNREAPKWADWMGPLVKEWDPYDHVTSAHNRIYRTPGNPWNDMQLIQRWDGGQKDFFLEQRRLQVASGRTVPLVNEESGYEDLWEKKPGERNAESRRRVAWEVCMAGGYQTTGETANRGTGFPPDTGGGWVNGRGDAAMTMLRGHAHMAEFFTSFDWWMSEPHDELVESPAMCLAEPGQVYAVYLPSPRPVTVKLEGPFSYRARWFDPRDGTWTQLPDASGPKWTAPMPPGEGDWALLVTAYDWRGAGGSDSVEKDGLQFNNNRWAGERGSMFARFGPPAVTWWTTHSGDRRDFPVSEPNVAVGSNWGRVTGGSPFPMKLSEIESFRACWSVTLPPRKGDQMFRVYYQLYFSDSPTGKYDAGDFAPTLYAVNCSPNWWGKDAGTHEIARRSWRICDSATSSGMGRYMIPLLVPYLEPDENGTIQVEDLDLKALIDWHVANGYYSPDSYCMVVHAAWEVWVLDQDLRTNDMAFVIKKKGEPAVTIPAWSSFVNKKLIEAKPGAPAGASTGSLPRLKVGPDRRFLVTADGRPFFWLGDTAWELFHRLTRAETERYLADRAAKGFNVIQAVALAELDGLTVPDPRGHLPLIDKDLSRPDVKVGPDDDYWDDIEWTLRAAEWKGLYIGLLPMWGKYCPADTGTCERYGRFIGGRFKDRANIIWILGGDRPAPTKPERDAWRAMARGIAMGVLGREDYEGVLMTYHTFGPDSASNYFHEDAWLAFTAIQSSHGDRILNWKMIEKDYSRRPVKPVIDLETTYPNLAILKGMGPGNDDHARRSAYWAVFSGAFGHTYGHNSVWQMYAKGRAPVLNAGTEWPQALEAPSATQMGHLRRLLESRPFLTQAPDPSLVAVGNVDDLEHVAALRGEGYALVYTPTGKPFRVRLEKIPGTHVEARWFDPRTGAYRSAGDFRAEGEREFTPPGQPGVGNDWVLALDARDAN